MLIEGKKADCALVMRKSSYKARTGQEHKVEHLRESSETGAEGLVHTPDPHTDGHRDTGEGKGRTESQPAGPASSSSPQQNRLVDSHCPSRQRCFQCDPFWQKQREGGCTTCFPRGGPEMPGHALSALGILYLMPRSLPFSSPCCPCLSHVTSGGGGPRSAWDRAAHRLRRL